MKVLIFDNATEAVNHAFSIVREQVVNKPKSVLGLATGGTPIKLYRKMVADFHTSAINYKMVRSINLDEYIGLDYYSIYSYAYYMDYNLFSKLNMDISNTHIQNGKAKDLKKECIRYNKVITDNPIDLQILGLGQNGHIGFNEPGTSFDLETHVVELDESTIEANKKYFGKLVKQPTKAFTMGIKSIMKSKKILLMAYGESKADAVKRMIEEEVTEDLPASILQKHDDCIILLDKEAASKLSKR